MVEIHKSHLKITIIRKLSYNISD